MAKPIVIQEGALTMSQVRSELESIKKRDGELNFRANKTDEYLHQFPLLDEKKAKELQEKLEGLNISRLKPFHIVKFIDVLPVTAEDVKVVLQGYPTLSVKPSDVKAIAETIKEFV